MISIFLPGIARKLPVDQQILKVCDLKSLSMKHFEGSPLSLAWYHGSISPYVQKGRSPESFEDEVEIPPNSKFEKKLAF